MYTFRFIVDKDGAGRLPASPDGSSDEVQPEPGSLPRPEHGSAGHAERPHGSLRRPGHGSAWWAGRPSAKRLPVVSPALQVLSPAWQQAPCSLGRLSAIVPGSMVGHCWGLLDPGLLQRLEDVLWVCCHPWLPNATPLQPDLG